MYIRSILFLLFILILTNCNPYPVYNYNVKSLENKKIYYKGREIIFEEMNGVEIETYFENQVDNDLIFNFSILNNTNNEIFIDPQMLILEIKKKDPSGLENKNITSLSPKDPDKEINRVNEQIKIIKTEKFNSDMADIAVNLGELIYDITELGKPKTSDELYAEYQITEEENQSYNLRNINYLKSLEELEKSKTYWENLTLRKTTLSPGQEISENVHFPLEEEAMQIIVCLPINGTDFIFGYSIQPIKN